MRLAAKRQQTLAYAAILARRATRRPGAARL